MFVRAAIVLAAGALVLALVGRSEAAAGRQPESGSKAGPQTSAQAAPRPKAQASDRAKTQAGTQKASGSKMQFLRLVRDAKRNLVSMETAIVTYAPRDCSRNHPTVDLVSAVHIGEKAYYRELNRRFAEYDVVLYELVAPEGTRIAPGGKDVGKHPVSMLQSFMTDVLELEFQLRAIDYTKSNLVHADLSPEQFAEAMRKRGESFWSLFLRMWGYAMSRQADAAESDAALLLALFSKNRALALKRAFAEQFEQFGGSLTAIEGPNGSALIADRNKKALEVLRKQIDAGKKKIAIFYGAGHMDDFDKHLREDFGLTPVETRWLLAWDLKQPGSGKR